MEISKNSRIESIDFLRGVVMVLMVLDHTRDYFHLGAWVNSPEDMTTTTPILFFTRFITHFCAPVFIFLAGTSAFLQGTKMTKFALSRFLLSRGLWFIFIEVTLINFIWWFDIHFSIINLQVFWTIGSSMIFLSLILFLPNSIILALSLIIIFGHNLLDGIQLKDNNPGSVLWYLLHQGNFIRISQNFFIGIRYPLVPWIAVMSLGYCFGRFYVEGYDNRLRKKYLLVFGLGAIVLFFVLRSINQYGNPIPWSVQKNSVYTILSFFNVHKYPPSLDFLLITIGPALLILRASESVKGSFFVIFGRVPFMYYVAHMLLVHCFALLGLYISGGEWRNMIITIDVLFNDKLANYGYPLWIVYLVWLLIVALLYPLSKVYMNYKATHKQQWWLSYL